LRLIVHDWQRADAAAHESRSAERLKTLALRGRRSREHIYNVGPYGAIAAQSAMLESVEITLAPGMDRDTVVPPIHLRTASWRICLLSALALGCMGNALALGLGRPQAHSVLGQPLVLSFPLSLRAGESLSMDCVLAEITAGGVKLAASKVGVRLEGESENNLRAIRVLSSVPIEEPILSVTLSLGCPPRLTRQFNALMDPPTAQGLASPDAQASGESPRVLSPALRAALATADAQPKELLGANLPDAFGQERLTASRGAIAGAAKAEGSSGSKRGGEQASKNRNSPSKAELPSVATRSKPAKIAQAAAEPKSVIAADAAPRLRLEAFEANSAAAISASAAASAAEAAMARLQQVESGLRGLQSEYRSNAQKLSALQQGLATDGANSSGNASPSFLAWGFGGLSLLLGTALVFLWRGRSRLLVERDSKWWGSESRQLAVEDAEPAEPEINSPNAAQTEAKLPQFNTDGLRGDKGANLAHFAAPEEHTIALPHSVTPDYSATLETMSVSLPDEELSGLARVSQLMGGEVKVEPLSVQLIEPSDGTAAVFGGASKGGTADQALVSVEALIDLEQQVDFFLVLGQDEAAVDLLHGQLKQGGGASSSALPYLKLMEICQQRGDALAFADIAGRYAVEFNSKPPAWDANLESGMGLEAFPAVVQSLQSRWTDSGASMVALQKLLSSKDGQSLSFDLPALRDLLLLYSVARDRSEHEVRGEEIDLFLPLEADFDAGHPTGFDLMATMVWQGKAGEGATADPEPVDVDILLDDSDRTVLVSGSDNPELKPL
jgi:hypothetical protein